jgi:hypothetical protein
LSRAREEANPGGRGAGGTTTPADVAAASSCCTGGLAVVAVLAVVLAICCDGIILDNACWSLVVRVVGLLFDDCCSRGIVIGIGIGISIEIDDGQRRPNKGGKSVEGWRKMDPDVLVVRLPARPHVFQRAVLVGNFIGKFLGLHHRGQKKEEEQREEAGGKQLAASSKQDLPHDHRT